MRKCALQRAPSMCLESCWLKHPPSQQKRRQLGWKINNAHACSISISRMLHGLCLHQRLLIACRKLYLCLYLFNYICIYVSIIYLPELSIYLFPVCLYPLSVIYLSSIIYHLGMYVSNHLYLSTYRSMYLSIIFQAIIYIIFQVILYLSVY